MPPLPGACPIYAPAHCNQVAAQYFAATPAALFLGNPLGKSFEPKPRKEIVRQKRRQNVSCGVCLARARARRTPPPSSEFFGTGELTHARLGAWQVEEERPVVDGEGEGADNKSSEKRKSQLLKVGLLPLRYRVACPCFRRKATRDDQ